jgi:hypothetical protein
MNDKSFGEDDIHVTSDSRRLDTYPAHTKRYIVHIAEQTSDLGVEISIVPCKQNGTGMVFATGAAQE